MRRSSLVECWEGTRAEKDDLIARLRAALRIESNVSVALLFGSFLGEGAFRDVDVAVRLDEPFGAMDVAALATRLWLAAGRPAFDIDVVPLNDAPPAFRIEAAAGVPLVERWEGAAEELAIEALSEKLDFEAAMRSIEAGG